VAGYIAFAATNNSGVNLASFTVGFDGEQWRNGGAATPNFSLPQTMTLQYGFGATFTDVQNWFGPGGTFDWTSPVYGAAAGATNGAAVDGNAAGLVAGRGGTINGLTWGNGQTLWLRWIELNDTGNDHALAIDNFTFTWAPGAPPKSLIWTPTTPVWDTTALNWTDETPAPSKFTTGDSVSFTDAGLAFSTVSIDSGGVSVGQISVTNTTGTYNLGGGPITSNLPLQKTGGGSLIMATTFSQGLNATGGTVRLAVPDVFGNASTVTLGEGTTFDLNGNNETIGALSLTGATVTTGAGVLTVNGTVTVGASATGSAIQGKLSTGSATRIFLVTDDIADIDLDLAADLTGAGRVNFDPAGPATVRIGGDNSAFTGGLQLDSGLTYLIDSTKAFGTAQTFLNGGTMNANVVLTGANKIGTAMSLGGNGATFLGKNIEFGGALSFFGAGAKTYSIEEGQTVTFSGTLDSTQQPGQTTVPNSTINKSGLGKLVLGGDSSLYAGLVRVVEGEVIAATAGSLGTGSVDVSPFFGAESKLTITASQTITSLNIGDGGIVVIAAPAAPEAVGLAAVPEPGAMSLLALGALGMIARRRTR
jgi:autotransporter-associated beta strand protein